MSEQTQLYGRFGPFELAEINVARTQADLEDPRMEGFVSRLDAINALAETSPGFVWRLQDESGNATSFRPYDDERVIINVSVWASVETFRQFVYRSAHGEMVRNGRQWFEPASEEQIAMWWLPAGERPTLDEAVERLAQLRKHGPSSRAFHFAKPFPPPE